MFAKIGVFSRRGLLAAAVALAVSASPAGATDISASGTINAVTLSYGNNYAFRVFVKQGSVDQLSQCSNSFAFLNTSDDNYAAKTATLLTAFSMKKTVWLEMDKDASGWCRIWDFKVGDS